MGPESGLRRTGPSGGGAGPTAPRAPAPAARGGISTGRDTGTEGCDTELLSSSAALL